MSTAASPIAVQLPHPNVVAGATDPVGREIVFPEGLLGFAGCREFRLQPELAAGRFLRLRATGGDPVEFLVVPVEPGAATLAPADIEEAATERAIGPRDLLLLAVVAARPAGNGIEASVNLRAPIFVDVARALAWQIVLRNPSYPLRLPLNRVS